MSAVALAAVEVVLAEAKTPLKGADITHRLLERGLWQTTGKTPAATIESYLAIDIRQHGQNSRFQRTAAGVYALRAWSLPEFVGTAHPAQANGKPNGDQSPSVHNTTLSFNDAAERVLEQFANKQPMHYLDITQKALHLGLITTAGQTPEATLYSQILTEIARRTKRGEQPRFVKHGKGMVGLSKWLPRGLAFQIEEHNGEVRRKLHSRLIAMPPSEFETLIGQLLAAIGFAEVAVTTPSGDGGIDVRGTLVVGDVIRISMAVQVKRWKQNVQAPVVQQVRGSLGTHDQGLIITTSDYSAGARQEAARLNAVPVALMNGEQLVALLVEHDIGVRRTVHDLIELGEDDQE